MLIMSVKFNSFKIIILYIRIQKILKYSPQLSLIIILNIKTTRFLQNYSAQNV